MLESHSIFQTFHDYFLTKRLPAREQLRLMSHPEPLLLPAILPLAKVPETTASQNQSNETPRVATRGLVPHVMYLNQPTALLQNPYQGYDACLYRLAYGEAVTVVRYQNDYAEVQRGAFVGWVKKDSLSERKADVWPVWTKGRWYSHDDDMTVRTRSLLSDRFFTAEAQLPLQPAEYISVELLADNRIISWPIETGRIPGHWHQLLRGVLGIHMTVSPLADGLMEWTDEAGVGHIAYVKEVLPDNSLRLEGIGILEEGIFESVLLPVTLWREWRPVFIEVG